MIEDTIKIMLGLLLVLFFPGYLLSLIVFKKLDIVERIALATGLSMAILVPLSFNLTLIGYAAKTKGITTKSVWFSLSVLCSFFLLILIITNHKKRIKRWVSSIVYGQ